MSIERIGLLHVLHIENLSRNLMDSPTIRLPGSSPTLRTISFTSRLRKLIVPIITSNSGLLKDFKSVCGIQRCEGCLAMVQIVSAIVIHPRLAHHYQHSTCSSYSSLGSIKTTTVLQAWSHSKTIPLFRTCANGPLLRTATACPNLRQEIGVKQACVSRVLMVWPRFEVFGDRQFDVSG